jgi:2-hydroxymethylglutarate dehydrogenase
MEVGFIGLGQMGKHMSRHVLEAGFNLFVNDLNPEAVALLVQKGAKSAKTPKELTESCRVIISCLPTPKSIEDIVYGKNGLKSGWKSGDIYIDMSTNSVSVIQKIAKDAKAMGVSVLDAPVSGGTRGADAGTLAIMVGGDAAMLEKVRKVLEAMGPKIFYVGDVGCGNIAKLVNNLISLTVNCVSAEGFALGMKAGIDVGVLRDVIQVSTGNNWTVGQYPNTLFKRNFEPGFKVSLGLKDIGLALDMGKELGVPLPIATMAQKDLQEAVKTGFADKDVGSVILNIEKKAKVEVKPLK